MNRVRNSTVVSVAGAVILVLCGSAIDRVEAQDVNEADVRFMQDMIHHHAQALEMTELVADRSNNRAIDLMARRIEITQKDEIAWMTDWLERRGQAVPVVHPTGSDTAQGTGGAAHDSKSAVDHPAADAHVHEADTHGHTPDAYVHEADTHEHTPDAHEHEKDTHEHIPDAHEHEADADDRPHMPGMLTPEQIDDLARASGRTFDRLFLKYMIHHHEGALTMVRDLLATEGAAQETEVFTFVAEIDADQASEIRRMQTVLDALSGAASDP